ncbi:MAG: WD40 repeat domain-containing protein [Planctomycetes bacterium]|nr:WD40 repeat domain-containing protein [Planctomycetota bacterium]
MTVCSIRWCRFALVAVGLFGMLFAATAQPPKPKDAADPADDPLPDGAKVRYGISRPILRGNPHVGLVGPKFHDFLAPTMEGGVRRYNLGTGRPLNEGPVCPGRVVVSADGKRAVVSRFGSLMVVEVASGKQLLAVKPPEGVVIVGIAGASLSANGNLLAYGGRGRDGKGEVVVWDVDKNAIVARVETAVQAPVFPLLAPNGTTLVTHGPPVARITLQRMEPGAPPVPQPPAIDPELMRVAQVWEVASGQELFRARVTGMGGMVVSSAFSGDSGFVALACGDGPVDLFDVNTGNRTQTLLGRKGMGVKVAVSPDGKTVAAVAPDYRVQRWNSADGKSLGVTDPPPAILVDEISGLAFSDNEKVVGWQTQAQFCTAWEAPSGRLLSPLSEHIAAIRSTSAPIDGKDLYTSGDDGRVFRWDYPTGAPNEAVTLHPARLPGHPLLRPVVVVSADGTKASGVRAPIEVFEMANGTDLFVVPPPSAAPALQSHFTSPDGTKVINVCRPNDGKRAGALVVWDLPTEKRVLELEIPPSTVIPKASMTPDGSRLVVLTHTRDAVTGQPAVLVTGWDVKTGKKLGEVADPTVLETVYVTAVGESQAVLLSRSGRLWSVDYVAGKIGRDIDRLPAAFNGEVPVYLPVVFSEDGKQFATGIQGTRVETYGVRVYEWPTGKQLRTYTGHVAPVSALRFTPDGKYLKSGSQDTSVLLWDLSKVPKEQPVEKLPMEKVPEK